MVKVHQSIIDENSCSDISKALKHRSKPDIYYLLMSNVYTCSSDNSFQVHVTKRWCEKGTCIFDEQQVLYEVGDHHTVFAGWISSDFSSSSVDSSRGVTRSCGKSVFSDSLRRGHLLKRQKTNTKRQKNHHLQLRTELQTCSSQNLGPGHHSSRQITPCRYRLIVASPLSRWRGVM